MLRTALILFFFGGILGTLGDFCHVISHTDGYPSPLVPLPGGQPIWVPFLFGTASLSIGLSHYWIERQFHFIRPAFQSLKQVLLGVTLFLVIYGISGFLPMKPSGIRDGILFVLAGLVWIFFDRTWQGLVLAASTSVVGTGVELTLTHWGAFYYDPTAANFNGVPSWLPWLYFSASVVVPSSAKYLLQEPRLPQAA